MSKAQPCVLIYNPISGHGHLDSWAALFVSILLERGFSVLTLTPDRMALAAFLKQKNLVNHPRLEILKWEFPSPLSQRIRQAWRWWSEFGHAYASRHPATRTLPGMTRYVRAKRRAFQLLVPPLFALSQAVHSYCRRMLGKGELSGEVQDHSEAGYLDPVEMGLRINTALKTASWRPDCMFNMYLDMYKTSAESWQRFGAICRLPWGGIRFVPFEAGSYESYYALPSLRGICFLDEATCTTYRARIPDKHFTYLPDITNTELPKALFPLAKEIRHRAAGRKVVFLGGSIGAQKNIARWCELVTLADPKRWFFVLVGEVHADTFGAEDAIAFAEMRANPPENLLLHTHYLKDEREFNAVIAVSDVLFAVYRNFRISSNMLAKAACFEKPILVSDGYLIAERVRRYGIGRTVPEDDARAMLDALEQIALNPVPKEAFSNYRADFSVGNAAQALVLFLEKVSAVADNDTGLLTHNTETVIGPTVNKID